MSFVSTIITWCVFSFSSNNKFSQFCHAFNSDQSCVKNSDSPPHKLNRPYDKVFYEHFLIPINTESLCYRRFVYSAPPPPMCYTVYKNSFFIQLNIRDSSSSYDHSALHSPFIRYEIICPTFFRALTRIWTERISWAVKVFLTFTKTSSHLNWNIYLKNQ